MKKKQKKRAQGGSVISGILIGLTLAILCVVGLLWYINTHNDSFKPAVSDIPSDPAAPEPETWRPKTTAVPPLPTAPEKTPASDDDALGAWLEKQQRNSDTNRPLQTIQSQAATAETTANAEAKRAAALLNAQPTISMAMVQIGAFSHETEAQKRRAQLQLMNISTRILPIVVNGRTLYRVMSPALPTHQAQQLQQQLTQEKIDSIIINIANP